MPDKKTIFIAFAMEDRSTRDLLRGQSLHVNTPFEYIDMSVKQPYETEWKKKVRTRILRSDGVIALISTSSLSSSGQKFEIECAKEERVPLLGLWPHAKDRTNIAGVNTRMWSYANIEAFINRL